MGKFGANGEMLNDDRKDFTVSERVEISRAIEAELRKRHGVRRDTLPEVENFPQVSGTG